MADLQPGAVFAGHRIEGVAGRGGMGIVYRATHLHLDHEVALKVISPNLARDPRFRHRFADESRLAAKLRHPNLVRIHHAGEEGGLLFVTMDLIDGADLRVLLNREDVLDPARAARIVGAVSEALDVAHAAGLVHRDVKPGNVLIEGSGDSERVYLTDFGLARHVEATSGVTATGAFVGTLDYVAPEQIRGERVDARADVYALGCVLFEVLTGNPPFATRGDKIAKMYAHLQEEPPRLLVLEPELPAALEPVAARALSKDPDERFPSAGDLARAVEAALAGGATVESERSVAAGLAAPEPPDPARSDESAAAESAIAEEESGAEPPPRDPPRGQGPTKRLPQPPGPSPAGGDRRRSRLVVGVVALAAVVAAAVLVLGGGDDDTPGPGAAGGAGVPADSGVVSAPGALTGEPVAVDGTPVAIAHGKGIWAADRAGGVVRVDPEDFEAIGDPIAIEGSPEGIAVDVQRGEVWVSGGFGSNTVTRFLIDDPGDRETFTVGTDPAEIAIGSGAAWVACGDGTVAKISVDDGSVESFDTGGEGSYGIALGDGRVWVTNRESDDVTSIRASDGKIEEQFDAGDNPKGIAFAADQVWVASTDTDELLRFDAIDSLKEPTPIAVGDEPRGVVAAFDSIWVANGSSNSVTRVDAVSGEEIGTVEDVGGADGSPEGITAGPELVWVANGTAGSVSAIDPDPADGTP